MKYREILLEQLKTLPYFDKKTIYQLSGQYGLKSTTVDTYISRSLARKDIIQLKKGMYVTTHFYEENKADISYKFYLANIIKVPSYISSWTALQYYDLITDTTHGMISVTPKVTRDYQTKAGNFKYHSIKKEFFSGFSLVKAKFDFFIASPSKALFDLLYFRTHQFRGISADMVDGIVEDLRIGFDEMEKKDRQAFHRIINDFFKKV